jgi:hypothetical protein
MNIAHLNKLAKDIVGEHFIGKHLSQADIAVVLTELVSVWVAGFDTDVQPKTLDAFVDSVRKLVPIINDAFRRETMQ